MKWLTCPSGNKHEAALRETDGSELAAFECFRSLASCLFSCSSEKSLSLCHLFLGSLLNLAKHPASTVQILGAEKALFRALKTKRDTPKFGLIYHASLVGQTTAKNKGKVSCRTVYRVGFFEACKSVGCLSFTLRRFPWPALLCFVIMWKVLLSHKSLGVICSCWERGMGLTINITK